MKTHKALFAAAAVFVVLAGCQDQMERHIYIRENVADTVDIIPYKAARFPKGSRVILMYGGMTEAARITHNDPENEVIHINIGGYHDRIFTYEEFERRDPRPDTRRR